MAAPTWTAPYWSQPPSSTHHWNLLEIKQGNLLSSHSLNEIASRRSGCVTFGRMDDSSLVDIVTAHESCSRLHARLAFDSSGHLWLRDFKTNNGTFVNKVRLPTEASGKYEIAKGSKEDGVRGCRGVMVYPGDVFKFGASTRIYCLEGPEEFDKEVKQKQHVENSLNANNDAETDQHEVQLHSECSWGMTPDDDPLQDQHKTARDVDPNLPTIEMFFSPSSDHKIPSSLLQLYKTYQTKQFKFQAIQTETSRIVQKEDRGVELTEGQTKQVEKNRERLENLEKDLDDLTVRLEEGIYSSIHGVHINLKKKRNMQSSKDEDFDDFFDRTAHQDKKQRINIDEAESEQSLIQKWKAFYESHEKQIEEVSRADHKSQKIQKEISSIDDEEEAFFLQNDLSLAKEELSKSKSVLEDIRKEWTETEYLLKIVNPKLLWKREDGTIGIEGVSSSDMSIKQQTKSDVKFTKTMMKEPIMMPPPLKTKTETVLDTGVGETSSSPAMHPSTPTKVLKTSRIVGPTVSTTSDISPTDSLLSEIPKSTPNKRRIGPSHPSNIGTLAALQQAVNVEKKDKPTRHSQDTQQNSTALPFDSRKDEWTAPKDQDGSGRTSLNEKFKGRY